MDRSAVVLVANDPFVGWLSRAFGSSVHLGKGEMAGFEWCRRRWYRERSWVLAWTLCHTDKDATDDLRAKIRSKMDVAKVFGALGVALLTFLLQQAITGGDEVWKSNWALASLLLIGAGTGLYFATLFAYDRLLMPTRFWSPRPAGQTPPWVVRRPPSGDQLVLYQNMMHIWSTLFVPACLLIGAGLLALGIRAFDGRTAWWLGAVAGVVGVTALWWWYQRPRLGAED